MAGPAEPGSGRLQCKYIIACCTNGCVKEVWLRYLSPSAVSGCAAAACGTCPFSEPALVLFMCLCVSCRFLRVRPDKDPEDASGPDLVRELYNRQSRRIHHD